MAEKKNSTMLEKFFLILFFLILFYLSYLVFKPFLITIMTAGVLAYITYPLYKRLLSFVRLRYLAAFIMTLFVFVVVAAPISIVGTHIWNEAVEGFGTLVGFADELLEEGGCEGSDSSICVFANQVVTLYQSEFFDRFIQDNIPDFSLVSSGQGLIFSVTGFIFHFFITFFAMFFFFADGDSIAKGLKGAIPLKKDYKDMIINRFKSITSGVIYGQLMTSLIQGLLAGIGFYIFDIGSPVLFGLLTAFTSMFPIIGAAGVWLPAAIVKISYSFAIEDIPAVWMGVGFVIYGTLIVSMVDNFLRPKFIGDKTRLHPILAFVGVLGGIALFGIIGLLLGPLVMALLVSTLEIYAKDLEKVD
ncbi:MAG: AI-2E family transporter [Candidatus Woesearchaeota archaeon]